MGPKVVKIGDFEVPKTSFLTKMGQNLDLGALEDGISDTPLHVKLDISDHFPGSKVLVLRGLTTFGTSKSSKMTDFHVFWDHFLTSKLGKYRLNHEKVVPFLDHFFGPKLGKTGIKGVRKWVQKPSKITIFDRFWTPFWVRSRRLVAQTGQNPEILEMSQNRRKLTTFRVLEVASRRPLY